MNNLKVKNRVYPVSSFAKMLNLGDDIYILSIGIENIQANGNNDIYQYITIEYVCPEEKDKDVSNGS